MPPSEEKKYTSAGMPKPGQPGYFEYLDCLQRQRTSPKQDAVTSADDRAAKRRRADLDAAEEEEFQKAAERARTLSAMIDDERPFYARLLKPKKNDKRIGARRLTTNIDGCEDRIMLSGTTGYEATMIDQSAQIGSATAGSTYAQDQAKADASSDLSWASQSSVPQGVEAALAPLGSHIYQNSLSPDGSSLALGLRTGEVVIVNARTGETERTIAAHGAYVRTLDWSADGRTLVTGSNDRTMKIWDAETGELRQQIALQSYAEKVDMSPDGKHVLVAESNFGVRTFNLETGEESSRLGDNMGYNQTRNPFAPRFSSDGSSIIFARDRSIRIADAATGQTRKILDPLDRDISTIEVSADGKWIVAGHDDGTVVGFDAATGRRAFTLHGNQEWVTDIDFSPEGDVMVTADSSGKVIEWDVRESTPVETNSWDLPGNADGLTINRDGKLFAIGGENASASVHAMQLSGVSIPEPTVSIADIDALTAERATAVTALEQRLAEALSAEQNVSSSKLTLESIQHDLAAENEKLLILQTNVSTAQAALETSQAGLASALGTEAERTAQKEQAAASLAQAEQTLNTAMARVSAANVAIEKASLSTKTLSDLNAQLAQSKAKVADALKTLDAAKAALQKNPNSILLNVIKNAAQHSYNTINTAEKSRQQTLTTQISAAQLQVQNDAPILMAAKQELVSAIGAVNDATVRRDLCQMTLSQATNAVQAAIQVRMQAQDAVDTATEHLGTSLQELAVQHGVLATLHDSLRAAEEALAEAHDALERATAVAEEAQTQLDVVTERLETAIATREQQHSPAEIERLTGMSIENFEILVQSIADAGEERLPDLEWQQSHNWIETLQHSGFSVYYNNAGESVGSGFMAASFSPNRTQYHLYELRSSGGSLELQEHLLYISEQGLQRLDPMYYERITGNTFLLKPGAPTDIVVGARFTDGRRGGGQFEILVTKSGDARSDVLPSEQMSFDGNILKVSGPGGDGFGDMVTEIRSGSNAEMTPGQTVNVLLNVSNKGTNGGNVTFEIHAGYTGTDQDAIVKTMTASFAGLETKSMSVNVPIPQNGGIPSTSSDWRAPQITIIAVLPDGTRDVVVGAAGKRPSGGSEAFDMETWTQAMNPQPMYAADGTTVIGMGGQLFTNVASNGVITDVEIEGVDIGMHEGSNEIAEVPNSKNTMIIVIYGSNQVPGQADENGTLPGFDQLVESLRTKYPETWGISPGYNPSEAGEFTGFGPFEGFDGVWALVESRTANNPEIKNIVIIGHSWGGGMAYEISNKIAHDLPRLNVAATVYVDAVKLTGFDAENRMPIGTNAMLNIFQSKTTAQDDSFLRLNGGTLSERVPTFSEIDLDQYSNTESHSSIDEASVPFILDFVQQRILVAPAPL